MYFENYKLKHGAVLKNRFVLAPMTTYSSNDDLTLSKEEEIYYNARAKEFGMVITAATAVNRDAQAFHNQISIRDERYLDSMKRLAKAINKEGSKAVLQLHHGGRMNQPNLYPNQDIVAPSSIKANRDYTVTPRELKTSEVYDIIDDFVNATKLAIKAGFDGIELHGANTYLLQQFYSPNSNQRDDEFGGSREARMRFPKLLVERTIAAKKELGKDDFIIGYRFSPEEIENPGLTIEDTLYLLDELCKYDIDYLHASTGRYNQSSLRDKDDLQPLVEKFMEVIKGRVPLIGVGGLSSMEDIEDAATYGYELFALGTIALSDVHVVTHLQQGVSPSKLFSKDSLLPIPLWKRIKSWKALENKGYILKD